MNKKKNSFKTIKIKKKKEKDCAVSITTTPLLPFAAQSDGLYQTLLSHRL